jgi:hypothetical protein
MNKQSIVIVKLGEEAPPSRYWQTQPVTERLAMVERLRHEYAAWRKNDAEQGFQRVYRIVKQTGR